MPPPAVIELRTAALLEGPISWFEDWIPDRATREAIGRTALQLYRFA